MESRQHLLDFGDESVELVIGEARKVLKVASEHQVVLHFGRRTGRDRQESGEVTLAVSTAASMFEGTDAADLRSCAVNPNRSSAGKLFVARYTSSVRRCAFCHTKRPLKSRIPPPTELIADG